MQDKLLKYKKKIREQQKSLALFDIIAQNVDYGIYVQDHNGIMVYENELATKIRENFLERKRKILDRTGKELPREKLPAQLALRIHKTQSTIVEITTAQKESDLWYHIRAVPVFNKHNKLVYIVNTWRDISNRITEERRREHFIAIGSHELRTPLAGIKVLNQVLSKLYYEKKYEQARPFFHKIDNKVNLLTRLIQDFIEVEKIRSGKLEFTPESFDFDEFIDNTILEMDSIYKSHTVKKIGSAKVKIVADRERIYEVLTNLIANARKYSPNSNQINVVVSMDEHKITVGVQDFGIGLNKENADNVFEPFYRVANPEIQREKEHGLGLGLYIAYKIVELHGGRMWVKSKIGKGSTFYFCLPRVIKKKRITYDF